MLKRLAPYLAESRAACGKPGANAPAGLRLGGGDAALSGSAAKGPRLIRAFEAAVCAVRPAGVRLAACGRKIRRLVCRAGPACRCGEAAVRSGIPAHRGPPTPKRCTARMVPGAGGVDGSRAARSPPGGQAAPVRRAFPEEPAAARPDRKPAGCCPREAPARRRRG